MPFAPAIPYQAPQLLEQGILSGAQTFNQDLMKALQKYEEDKKQREFNTGMFDSLKNDPNTAKYIPTDALQKWDSMNGDKQAGVLAGVARRAQTDVQARQMQQAEELKNAQTDEANARANLLWAQGNEQWSGAGPDSTLDLSPDEVKAAEAVGRVPLRTSPKSFQYVEDPNNPANLGVGEPTPVKDPRDPKKIIGLQQSNGVVKYFPKPTDMETLVNAGLIKAPAAPPTSGQPATTSAQQFPIGTRARKGDKWFVMTATGWQPE